MRRVDLEKGHM
ncbi:Protein of unknown function [Bacillus toyonensis]|nr:Protein of unknown function [Bacillus toyonensis]